MAERVLFDVNVLLDVLESRQPHISGSGPALQLAASGRIKGFVAASSVDTLAFMIRRNATSAQTNAVLEDLLEILEVAPVTGDIIRAALKARWNGTEDTIIYHAALEAGCTRIVTRNVRDFRTGAGDIEVIPPEKLRG